MTIRPLIALVALVSLSACSVPESRLRAGLIRAGVPEPMADCMADRMAHRLSLKQLMRLGDLPKASKSDSIGQFVHRVRALNDPEIIDVTTNAAARCAIGL